MDRRVFLVLLLAGCADTSTNAPLSPSTAAPTPLGPAPMPPAPKPVTAGGDINFDAWLAAFK